MVEALRVVNQLQTAGSFERYAVGGAMATECRVRAPDKAPVRPDPRLEAGMREAKTHWQRSMVDLPFAEKVRIVMEMQRRLYPILAQRRSLATWERPWPETVPD